MLSKSLSYLNSEEPPPKKVKFNFGGADDQVILKWMSDLPDKGRTATVTDFRNSEAFKQTKFDKATSDQLQSHFRHVQQHLHGKWIWTRLDNHLIYVLGATQRSIGLPSAQEGEGKVVDIPSPEEFDLTSIDISRYPFLGQAYDEGRLRRIAIGVVLPSGTTSYEISFVNETSLEIVVNWPNEFDTIETLLEVAKPKNPTMITSSFEQALKLAKREVNPRENIPTASSFILKLPEEVVATVDKVSIQPVMSGDSKVLFIALETQKQETSMTYKGTFAST